MGFPSLETLDKSSDGSEYIYGGSVGINRILGFFRSNAYNDNKYNIRILIVNMFTLFRNVYKKDTSDAALEELLSTEIRLLSQYYEAYAYAMRTPTYRPILVTYIPDYESAIPKDILHKKSETAKVMHDTYERIMNSNFAKHVLDVSTSGMTAYIVMTSKGIYPVRTIMKFIQENNAMWKLSPVHNAVLISHCPLDWYLLENNNMIISVLESYTGNMKFIYDIGERLSGSIHVPFNKYTHLLFGDKYHIGALVKPKDKKKMIDLAEKNHWTSRPREFIVSDICSHLQITPDVFSRFRI
jgi:hypothetical protein